MRISLQNVEGKEIGRVDLKDGVAVPDGPDTKRLLDGTKVFKPGNPGRELTPKNGPAYLEALPFTFRGPYLTAVKK